jgi:hypothetical protein
LKSAIEKHLPGAIGEQYQKQFLTKSEGDKRFSSGAVTRAKQKSANDRTRHSAEP